MTTGLQTLLAAVRGLPTDRTRWLGIDGFGAAGKTTLAERIETLVPGSTVVHTDDFHGEGVTEWDWPRFGREVVAPLREGRSARYAIWTWGDDGPRGYGEVAPGSLVILEGVSATRRETDVPWDLTVWVDAPADVRARRRHVRDGVASEAVWAQQWLLTEADYATRERPWERVDFRVAGTDGGTELR